MKKDEGFRGFNDMCTYLAEHGQGHLLPIVMKQGTRCCCITQFNDEQYYSSWSYDKETDTISVRGLSGYLTFLCKATTLKISSIYGVSTVTADGQSSAIDLGSGCNGFKHVIFLDYVTYSVGFEMGTKGSTTLDSNHRDFRYRAVLGNISVSKIAHTARVWKWCAICPR